MEKKSTFLKDSVYLNFEQLKKLWLIFDNYLFLLINESKI